MSDVVRVNVKTGKMKARVAQDTDNLTQYADVNEAEELYQRELEKMFSSGFEEGYKKAQEEIAHLYQAELETKSNEFAYIMQEMEKKVIEYGEAFDKIIIRLSEKIAEHIIKREISGKTIVEAVLKEALHKVTGTNNIIVKINSADYSYLSGLGKFAELEQNFSKITFEQDGSVFQGGCIIETSIGNVDARINTQISEVVKHLESSMFEETE